MEEIKSKTALLFDSFCAVGFRQIGISKNSSQVRCKHFKHRFHYEIKEDDCETFDFEFDGKNILITSKNNKNQYTLNVDDYEITRVSSDCPGSKFRYITYTKAPDFANDNEEFFEYYFNISIPITSEHL